MTIRRLRLALFALAVTLAAQQPASLFDGLRWRMIGRFRGGVSVAATGISGDPNIFYFGSVGGCIWRSMDRKLASEGIRFNNSAAPPHPLTAEKEQFSIAVWERYDAVPTTALRRGTLSGVINESTKQRFVQRRAWPMPAES